MRRTRHAFATVKHIIATCIDLGLQAADSASKYRLLTEFKTQLKSKVKHAPKLPSHLHLVKYPADPLSLPEALRSTAYGRLTFFITYVALSMGRVCMVHLRYNCLILLLN